MKKGFTLIELLAVIVIIAVIAVIATPIILNIIEDTRREAKENSTLSVVKAVQNYYAESQLGTEETLPLTITFPNEDIILSGENPTSGSVTLNADGTYNATDLVINGYICNSENILAYCKKATSAGTLKTVVETNIGATHLTSKSVNGTSVTKVIGNKTDKATIKNWVWYSGQLWQVLETTSNYVKLVTANSVTAISYGDTNTWSSSWVRKWLNEIDSNSEQDGIYYNNLSRTDLLLTGNFCLDEPSGITLTSGKVTSFTSISNCSSVSTDKVGLLTFEDYVYALDGTVSGSLGGSFLDEDERSFTITKHGTTTQLWSTHNDNSSYVTYDTALVAATNTNAQGVRPVIYLSADLLIESKEDGINADDKYGMAKNPYILTVNEEKDSGDYLNTVTVGSYIYISEEGSGNTSVNTLERTTSRISYTYDKTKVRYRVIGVNSDGTIMIQRADILRGLSSTVAMSSGINVPYFYLANSCDSAVAVYTGCNDNNYFKPTQGSGAYAYADGENVGYFLNNTTNGFYTWLSSSVQTKIVNANWNLNVYANGLDYVRSLFNTDTSGTYPTRISDGVVSAKIGMPIWGDMFSGNDLNTNVLLINRENASNRNISLMSNYGHIYGAVASVTYANVRPTFNLISTMKIESGSGTMTNPYVLGW